MRIDASKKQLEMIREWISDSRTSDFSVSAVLYEIDSLIKTGCIKLDHIPVEEYIKDKQEFLDAVQMACVYFRTQDL